MRARRRGRIHQIRETGSNTPKWGLPGKSKLFQRCNVKEDMFFSITEKQVQLKKKYIVSRLNSADIQNKGNKSKPDDWLRFISVILIGTFSSSSRLKNFRLNFFSRPHIIKGELGGNGYNLGFKHQRTSVFFTLKSYHINVFNMDFTKIQVQSYVILRPEKGKILNRVVFSAISYLFCSRQLCKYSLTSQRK